MVLVIITVCPRSGLCAWDVYYSYDSVWASLMTIVVIILFIWFIFMLGSHDNLHEVMSSQQRFIRACIEWPLNIDNRSINTSVGEPSKPAPNSALNRG